MIFLVPIIIFALKSSGRLPLVKWLIEGWLVKMTSTVLLQGQQYYGLIIRE